MFSDLCTRSGQALEGSWSHLDKAFWCLIHLGDGLKGEAWDAVGMSPSS